MQHRHTLVAVAAALALLPAAHALEIATPDPDLKVRLDLLAEFDISAKNFGARLSGNGWHDSVYLRSNSYQGTEIHAGGNLTGTVISTANSNPGQAGDKFLPSTRRQPGEGSVLLRPPAPAPVRAVRQATHATA